MTDMAYVTSPGIYVTSPQLGMFFYGMDLAALQLLYSISQCDVSNPNPNPNPNPTVQHLSVLCVGFEFELVKTQGRCNRKDEGYDEGYDEG